MQAEGTLERTMLTAFIAVAEAVVNHHEDPAFAEEAMVSILARFVGTVDCNVKLNDII